MNKARPTEALTHYFEPTLWQFIVMIFIVCTVFSSQMVIPLWIGAIIDDLSLSPDAAGTVASVEFGTVAVVSVLMASRVHLLNPKLFVALGSLLLITGNVFAAYAESLNTMIASRAMAGCGKGIVVAVVFALCAGTVNPTRTFATLNTSYAVFAAGFYLLIPAAVEARGAEGAFLVMALVAFAGFTLIFWFPKREASPDSAPVVEADYRIIDIPLYGFLALLVLVFIWMSHGAVWTFLERLGGEVGLSVAEVGQILSLGAFVTIGGPLLARALDTRFGNVLPLLAAASLMIVCTISIVHVLSATAYTIAVPIFLLMALFSVPYVMGILSLADPSGRLSAASSAAMTAGGSLGALTGGVAISRLGYSGLGWTAILILGMVIVTVLFIRRDSTFTRTATQPATQTASAS